MPWDYTTLSRNPNLTVQFVKDNPQADWNWHCISWNIAISLNDIKNNPTLPWTYDAISYNPNLTMQFIKDNPQENWDWSFISSNEFKKHPLFKPLKTKVLQNLYFTKKHKRLKKLLFPMIPKDLTNIILEYLRF